VDWLPTPKKRRFAQARQVLRDAVVHVIAERRRSAVGHVDLLSMLLEARDEETGERMTDDQLRVEVTTFLLAGQETTSLALTWIWYLLSQHAGARVRLEEETRHGARRASARLRGSREPAVYADGDRRSHAALSAGLGVLAAGAGGRRARWLPSAARLDRLRRPYVQHRLPALWDDPTGSTPSASHRSAARIGRSSPTCPSERAAAVHRESVRSDRDPSDGGHAGPALSAAACAGAVVEPWPLITLRPRFGMPMVIESRPQ
jgi:hypothetical protein